MHDDQVTGDGGILQNMRGDFALRVSHDERMPGEHPVGNRGQDNALRLTRTRTAERQDTARHVFSAEAELPGSHIEPPLLLAPECAEQDQAFGIRTAEAAVLAQGAEVRRSQRPAFDRSARAGGRSARAASRRFAAGCAAQWPSPSAMNASITPNRNRRIVLMPRGAPTSSSITPLAFERPRCTA